MKITIDIKTENAAFEESDYEPEVEKLVAYVSKCVSNAEKEGLLFDSNGNKVGKFRVTGK